MNAIELALRSLDDVWSHQWESIQEVLAGLPEAEAAWQPPAYAAVEREAGWPDPGSVLWHVAHLAHCKRYYARLILDRHESEQPEAEPRQPAADLAGELAALREAHLAQREAIAALVDSDLDLVMAGGETVAARLAMFVRHDAWHAGQIAMVRRLWRECGRGVR